MWLLKFLPDWIFYGMLVAGAIGIVASKFAPAYYRSAVMAASAGVFLVGVFMAGAIHDNDAWLARVKELELKSAKVEVESTKENTKVEVKVIEKTQVVKVRGDDIIRYVDREVVKYDESCKIPKEFTEAINKAAEQVK